MKMNRLYVITAFCILSCLSLSWALEEAGRPKRALRIFSKAPEGEIYKGWNLPKHADNALQGGTIGLEYDAQRLAGPVGSVWRRVRKFLSRRKDWKDEKEGRGWGGEDLEELLVGNGIDPRGKPTMRIRKWEKNEEEQY